MSMIETPIRFGDYAGTAHYHDHRWWTPARPICDFLGLSWGTQRAVIRRIPGLSTVFIKNTVADGKSRETLMLPTGKIALWLASISPSKVADAARPALVDMQRRIDEVLTAQINEAFGIPAPADLDDLLTAPLPHGRALDLPGILAVRQALLSEPGVARAALMFKLGLPGTKTGTLLGRSAYWANNRRRKLEALFVLPPRPARVAPTPPLTDADGQADLFGENPDAQ